MTATVSVQTKRCPHCQEEKPTSEFWANKRNSDKLQSWCKRCTKESQRATREEIKRLQRMRQKRMSSATPAASVTHEDAPGATISPTLVSPHLDAGNVAPEYRIVAQRLRELADEVERAGKISSVLEQLDTANP